jgi:uncharacterized protein YlxW (UPF0749 family)
VAVQNITAEQTELQKEVRQIIADLIVLKKRVEQLETEVANLKEQNKKQNMYIVIAFIIGLIGAAN